MNVPAAASLTLLKRLWSLVPSGGSLPEHVWRGRYKFLVGLTWFHAVIITLNFYFGLSKTIFSVI